MNNIKNQGLMIPSKNYQKLLLTAGLIYNMSYIPVIIYNIIPHNELVQSEN